MLRCRECGLCPVHDNSSLSAQAVRDGGQCSQSFRTSPPSSLGHEEPIEGQAGRSRRSSQDAQQVQAGGGACAVEPRAADAAGDLCERGPALSKPYEPGPVLDRIKRLLAARANIQPMTPFSSILCIPTDRDRPSRRIATTCSDRSTSTSGPPSSPPKAASEPPVQIGRHRPAARHRRRQKPHRRLGGGYYYRRQI